VRMPFGRYKGYAVEDLPEDYLTWLWESCDLREPLCSAVQKALSEDGAVSRSTDLPADLRPVAQEIVSIGYRLLALRLHPDHASGDHKAMIRLNAARDWLRKQAA
jgi:hypothetical protein